MLGFWFRVPHHNLRDLRPLAETFQAVSSVPVDILWRKVVNLADVSWHPLLSSTNVPKGLIPKPGLIYQAVSRLSPIPIRIFVERVLPREMLTVRILAIPGLEERVTYQVESTLCGTRLSYSVTLRGWLSPIVWSFIRPYAARVAAELVQAAEQEAQDAIAPSRKSHRSNFQELLGLLCLLLIGHPFVTRS